MRKDIIPVGKVKITDQGSGVVKYFKTSINDYEDSAESGIICVGSQGFFSGQENRIEPLERTYSGGVVLPPKPVYRGMDVRLDFIVWSQNKNDDGTKEFLKYINFRDFFLNSTILEIKVMNVQMESQVQRVEIVDEERLGSNGFIKFALYLKGNQVAFSEE